MDKYFEEAEKRFEQAYCHIDGKCNYEDLCLHLTCAMYGYMKHILCKIVPCDRKNMNKDMDLMSLYNLLPDSFKKENENILSPYIINKFNTCDLEIEEYKYLHEYNPSKNIYNILFTYINDIRNLAVKIK